MSDKRQVTSDKPESPLLLDAVTIDAIARRVVEMQGLLAPAPVLTVQEACDYVRVGCQSSLDNWIAAYAPNARCGKGRFTRSALTKGRELEARGFFKTKPRGKKAAAQNPQQEKAA